MAELASSLCERLLLAWMLAADTVCERPFREALARPQNLADRSSHAQRHQHCHIAMHVLEVEVDVAARVRRSVSKAGARVQPLACCGLSRDRDMLRLSSQTPLKRD